MSGEQPPHNSLGLLAHYVPRDVLVKARELARRFEQEEAFRAYLLKKIWIVIPAAFVFFAISTGAGLLVLFGIVRFAPDTAWVRIPLFLVALATGLGGFLLQLYLLFSWLQRRRP